jgi:hypothetical protein
MVTGYSVRRLECGEPFVGGAGAPVPANGVSKNFSIVWVGRSQPAAD